MSTHRRTRVKFCGMTRAQDVHQAVELGVDALGFVLAARSPRTLTPDAARELLQRVPPLVSRVLLFMDQPASFVGEALAQLSCELLQFHGREDAAYCRSFGKPYLKAIAMQDADDASAVMQRFPDAAGFVLDAHRTGAAGGTGAAFDWQRVPAQSARPWLLAGGLAPANVAQAIAQLRPFGVDVSSGIESAPGCKDYAKMRAFLAEVQRAGTT